MPLLGPLYCRTYWESFSHSGAICYTTLVNALNAVGRVLLLKARLSVVVKKGNVAIALAAALLQPAAMISRFRKNVPAHREKTKWDAKAKRPKTSRCHSKLFAALPASEDCMSDFQEIRVQDDMQALDVGVVPQSCAVTVFGDMVGVAQPGDSVTVEGIVYQRWRPTFPGKRIEVELFIEAVNVERLARDSSEGIVTQQEPRDTGHVRHVRPSPPTAACCFVWTAEVDVGRKCSTATGQTHRMSGVAAQLWLLPQRRGCRDCLSQSWRSPDTILQIFLLVGFVGQQSSCCTADGCQAIVDSHRGSGASDSS